MAVEDLTIYERLAVQMEYVVPLVRDLQKILGEDAVNAALEKRLEMQRAEAQAAATEAGDLSLANAAIDAFAAGGTLEYEILTSESDRFDMNVTSCGYARMMERLGARDIGHLLICNFDYAMADRGGLELTHTQTCMQGGDHCDFRYRRAKR